MLGRFVFKTLFASLILFVNGYRLITLMPVFIAFIVLDKNHIEQNEASGALMTGKGKSTSFRPFFFLPFWSRIFLRMNLATDQKNQGDF